VIILFGARSKRFHCKRFDDWKGEYVRIEDGEDMVDEIDRQDGWSTKRATFHTELVDLNSDSRVGYVPSKLAL
jgi:hypothetical protein